MMEEKWKKISGWHYKVSNFGRVKSLPKITRGGNNERRFPGRILKPAKNHSNKYGYLHVVLCKNNKRKTFYIHLLVLRYFGPKKPSPRHEANHIDGDKTNNGIDNLEWVTHSENKIHADKLRSTK